MEARLNPCWRTAYSVTMPTKQFQQKRGVLLLLKMQRDKV